NGYSYAFENPINYFDPYGLLTAAQQSSSLNVAGDVVEIIVSAAAIGFGGVPGAVLGVGGLIGGFLHFAGDFGTFASSFAGAGANPGGGGCPTFIQQPVGSEGSRMHLSTNQVTGLRAGIEVPRDDCLLKSDIPIYGVAYGPDFK